MNRLTCGSAAMPAGYRWASPNVPRLSSPRQSRGGLRISSPGRAFSWYSETWYSETKRTDGKKEARSMQPELPSGLQDLQVQVGTNGADVVRCLAAASQYELRPPSALMVWAFTIRDSSEARKSARCAMSTGVPIANG